MPTASTLPAVPETPYARRRIAPADIAACRASLRQGSRTFLAASWLLPRAVRDPACALYAFCRMADDAVDDGADEARAVAVLRERLARVYDTTLPVGELATPADRALASVVARFDIPRALPEALIEGFAWDAQARRYETLDDVQDYAARVAGTVGAMMALLMGVRAPDALARACDLGVAMQLSNIARDVGEDAAMGRLYLPRAWMREAGIDPDAWLAQPRFSPALGSVVQRLLATASVLYDRVGAGVAQLPLGCRAGINAARFLYADIGWQVAQRGFDSVSGRAVVPRARKAGSLGRALLALRPPRDPAAIPVLPANAFLVHAVSTHAISTVEDDASRRRRSPAEQAIWVIGLFERLEQRDRGRRPASLPGNLA